VPGHCQVPGSALPCLQLISYLADFGLSLEQAFHAPRIEASTPTIKINALAGADVAAHVSTRFPVEVVPDTVYPVQFAVPSAVLRDSSGNIGMTHPSHPWAAVAVGVPAG
jgi:gamma-glutamyltranspeptidase / glutathione hydrolase